MAIDLEPVLGCFTIDPLKMSENNTTLIIEVKWIARMHTPEKRGGATAKLDEIP
jgi:hypothetical protein